jgi:hypothetical protein
VLRSAERVFRLEVSPLTAKVRVVEVAIGDPVEEEAEIN